MNSLKRVREVSEHVFDISDKVKVTHEHNVNGKQSNLTIKSAYIKINTRIIR